MTPTPRPPIWRRLWNAVRGSEPTPLARNVFVGALGNRLTADWLAPTLAPAAETAGAITILRNRARDLERNNPVVRRYLALCAENIAGPMGLRLQAKNLQPDGMPNTQANSQIERAWAEWSEAGNCTMDGRLNFPAFQALVVRAWKRDGEALIQVVPDGPFGLRLALIDPDRMDDTVQVRQDATGNAIKNGVEVDGWGRAVAYHAWTAHYTDYGTDRRIERIPADQVIHLFRPRRWGQVRGDSELAAVMLMLRHLDGFVEAAVVNARTGAAKMGFIEQDLEAGAGPEPDTLSSEMEISPGVVSKLAPGEKFTSFDPDYPSGEFRPFVAGVLHLVAQGLNVSHASLTGDLSEVNYSSLRGGEIKERDGWRMDQELVAAVLLTPLYRRWLRAAWAAGRLSLRMLPDEYGVHGWQARGWDWVDPLKDVQAKALEIAHGFTSRQRVVGEQGLDPEDLLAELAADHELAEEYGVVLAKGAPNGATQGPPDQSAANAKDDGAGDRPGGTGAAGGGGRAHPHQPVLRLARAAVVRG